MIKTAYGRRVPRAAQTSCDHCEKQKIPIDQEKGIWNLVAKARHILKLIEETSSSSFRTLKLPFRNFDYKKPDKLLEPENERQKSQAAGISSR
jgi:hypothetical protein